MPVLVAGDGVQGGHIEGLIGAADEEFDFLGLEERERVAAADGEEAALEGLVLAGDLRVEEISHVEIYELGAVRVGDGSSCAIVAEGDFYDLAVPFDFDDEVAAECRLDVAFVLKKLAKATREFWFVLGEVFQGVAIYWSSLSGVWRS